MDDEFSSNPLIICVNMMQACWDVVFKDVLSLSSRGPPGTQRCRSGKNRSVIQTSLSEFPVSIGCYQNWAGCSKHVSILRMLAWVGGSQ